MTQLSVSIPENALEEGWKLARENGLQFLSDAELLVDRSPGHAIALANLGFEEFGKMGILRAMKLDSRLHDLKNEKLAMGSHEGKFAVALKGLVPGLDVTRPEAIEIVGSYEDFQLLKERGLYVAYHEGKWLSPQSGDLARVAKEQVSAIRQLISRLDSAINSRT